jgi:hypothetical protein
MDAKEFEGLSHSQAAKFRAYYSNEYSALFPPPIVRIHGLDWKFYGLMVTSISTVIVAALRTAQMFYFAEEMSSQFWGLGTQGNFILGISGAFFSMLAFEGGLALISAIKTSDKSEISDNIYSLQIFLLLAISIFAGLGQSLGLVKNIPQEFMDVFTYLLVFVMGVGASFAAWFSGEILGVQLQKFSVRKAEAEERFLEQKRIHLQNARKNFLQKWETEKQNRTTEQKPREIPTRTEQRSSPRVQNRTSGGISEKSSLIFSELEKCSTEQSKLLSFSELAEILREKYPEQNFSSSGYISTKRKEWIQNNQLMDGV